MGTDPRAGLRRLLASAGSGELGALCRRHGVRLLVAFGSATDATKRPRDLDIAVAFAHRTQGDLVELLEDLVRVSGTEDVDLMDLGRADPVARERALVGTIPLHEGEPSAFANAQMAAILERMETEPLRRLDLELMAR
ncbi:MAG: nucleotidyltransferase family protein [Carbonactinosporaceae bacterium]